MTCYTSDNGIKLIKSFENLSLSPYSCPNGFLTIGYGHKIHHATKIYSSITLEEAEKFFLTDLYTAERAVLRNIKVFLQQNQFDALASFTFNVGGAALQRSTLRRKINDCYFEDVKEEFGRWVYCKNRKVRGLIFRRKVEADLFMDKLTQTKKAVYFT